MVLDTAWTESASCAPLLMEESRSSTDARAFRKQPRRAACTSEDSSTANPTARDADALQWLLISLGQDPENARLRLRVLCAVSAAGSSALSQMIASDHFSSRLKTGIAEVLPDLWKVRDAVGRAETNLALRHFLHSAEPALRLSAAYGYLGTGDRTAAREVRAAFEREPSAILAKQLAKVARLLEE